MCLTPQGCKCALPIVGATQVAFTRSFFWPFATLGWSGGDPWLLLFMCTLWWRIDSMIPCSVDSQALGARAVQEHSPKRLRSALGDSDLLLLL